MGSLFLGPEFTKVIIAIADLRIEDIVAATNCAILNGHRGYHDAAVWSLVDVAFWDYCWVRAVLREHINIGIWLAVLDGVIAGADVECADEV